MRGAAEDRGQRARRRAGRAAACALLAAAAWSASPRPAAAQAEIQLSGLWAGDLARGKYVGVLTEELIGAVRVDTVEIGGQRVARRTARPWMLAGFAGIGVVDGPHDDGIQASAHAQVGLLRSFPGKLVDRLGVSGDVVLPQGGAGVSALLRLEAVFWIQAGAMRSRDAWRPLVSARLPGTVLAEVCRFVHAC